MSTSRVGLARRRPLGTWIAGWFTAAAMLLMLIGKHTGRTEDLWRS